MKKYCLKLIIQKVLIAQKAKSSAQWRKQAKWWGGVLFNISIPPFLYLHSCKNGQLKDK